MGVPFGAVQTLLRMPVDHTEVSVFKVLTLLPIAAS